jgi:RNA polymerase sigma factor (sigma-70 family)
MTFVDLWEDNHARIEAWFAHQPLTYHDPEGWTAQTFAKAWAHRKQHFTDDHHQVAWVWSIAKNLYRDEGRHIMSTEIGQRFTQLGEDAHSLADRHPSVATQVEDREQYIALAAMVMRTVTRQQAAVVLLTAEGLPVAMIAERLRIAPGAVRALLWRARCRLRQDAWLAGN